MNNRARYLIRVAFGSLASLAVFFALDLLPWKIDITDYSTNALYVFLSITAAMSVFIAAFAGAIVARVNFLGPAFALSVLGWTLVVSFLKAVSAAYNSNDFVPYLVANATGLTIVIGGGVSGALLGQRFAKPVEDVASNAP
jgi:hypothetical protein